MSEKKDLTRIEDLGEFFHQIEEEQALPDLPLEDSPEESAFETSFESLPELPAADEDNPFTASPTEEVVDENFNFENAFTSSSDFSSPEEDDSLMREKENETSPSSRFEQFVTEQLSPTVKSMTEETMGAYELDREALREQTKKLETQAFTEEKLLREQASIIDPLPEDFSDVKKFAEEVTLAEGPQEANPAYSVVIRHLKFIEDIDALIDVIRETGLSEETTETLKRNLERGSLLIPRISEYAAIVLCHKLRGFDVDLTMGLSDAIFAKTSLQDRPVHLLSKKSLTQNQEHHFAFKNHTTEAKDIQLTTLPHLEGQPIVRYLGLATEQMFLDAETVEDENSQSIMSFYTELAQKLKAHALEVKANGIVGIQYQLSPILAETSASIRSKYRLICTGNLVWVQKQ